MSRYVMDPDIAREFQLRLATKLGLDPEKVGHISAHWDGTNQVNVEWEGRAVMSVEEFNQVLEESK